jgi:pimeloyl-ACP methyl ester carboxylesterase
MPRATIRGTAIHYDDVGPRGGVPIVFAHGLLWSGAMFAPQMAELARTHRCCAFDFPGQGLSGMPERGYDMDTLTDIAADLAQWLGATPCHFVGLSMGGFVGLRLAIRRPELLRSLTLIDSAADPEPVANRRKYRAMSLVARLAGMGPLLGAVERVMFGQDFLDDASRGEERALLRRRLLGLDEVGMRLALEGVISRKGVMSELGRITTPTLVLHGEQDRAIARSRAEATAAGIPGAKLVWIPRAGHTSTLEQPAAITRELTAFVDLNQGA